MRLLAFSLALISFSCFSYTYDRFPATSDDIGVVDQDGNVLIVYTPSNISISIESCPPGQVISAHTSEARQACQEGKRVGFSFYVFKKAIRDLILYSDPFIQARLLSALSISSSDFKKYSSIATGEQTFFEPTEIFSAVKQKIDNAIDDLVNSIKNNFPHFVMVLSESSHRESFAFIAINQLFNINQRKSCGTSGTIEQRISDCRFDSTYLHGTLKLVTRSENGNRFFYDEATGRIWAFSFYHTFQRQYERYTSKKIDHIPDVCAKLHLFDPDAPANNWVLPTFEASTQLYDHSTNFGQFLIDRTYIDQPAIKVSYRGWPWERRTLTTERMSVFTITAPQDRVWPEFFHPWFIGKIRVACVTK